MDNNQQPIQPQQNNNLPPTIPVTPEPKKTKFLIYVLAGVLIVGVAAAAGIFFLKDKSPQTELTPPLTNETQTPLTDEAIEVKAESRAVFAVVEGLKMNIYSSKEDGTDRKLLFRKLLLFQNLLFPVEDAKISPTGNLIAYKFFPKPFYRLSDPAAVFLIDSQGQNKKKILDNVESFIWSRDGKKIIYSTETPKFDDNPLAGAPLFTPGAEWHIFDITSSIDMVIAKPEQQFHSLGLEVSENKFIFFIDSYFFGSGLVLFDSVTQKSDEIKLPEGYKTRQISTNPSGSRTIVLLLPEDYGINYSCDFYELETSGNLGKRFIADRNYSCKGIAWNGDDEIYYEKGTGPKGTISTSETSESRYYILFSVYKYNFKTEKGEWALKSDGKEVYRFQGVLENQGFVVSNESGNRTPKYILEVRKLDGSNPQTLIASDEKMLFIGWSK